MYYLSLDFFISVFGQTGGAVAYLVSALIIGSLLGLLFSLFQKRKDIIKSLKSKDKEEKKENREEFEFNFKDEEKI